MKGLALKLMGAAVLAAVAPLAAATATSASGLGAITITLIATDVTAATAGRTRPLCRYPEWPRYNGSGSASAAASFSCVRA